MGERNEAGEEGLGSLGERDEAGEEGLVGLAAELGGLF